MKIVASEKFCLSPDEMTAWTAMSDLCRDLYTTAKSYELQYAASDVLDSLEILMSFLSEMEIE